MIIKNATVISPRESIKTDVFFSEKTGRIEAIAQDVDKRGEEVIDAEGMLLLPGGVDMHVHFRDPGFTQKEDFFTGTRAAIAGGITTVCDMPNTKPPTDTLNALTAKKATAAGRAACDYLLFFGANSKNLDKLRQVQESGGVAGAKVFMGPTTAAEASFPQKIFSSFSGLVAVHAEDEQMVAKNEEAAGKSIGNEATTYIHNKVRPPKAAEKAVAEAIAAAEASGGRLHVCHASTQAELALIEAAKRRGVKVTCEVTPHHLFFNEEDAAARGNILKVNPPLRSEQDRQALWKAIADGIVDCVASDHAPHLLEEKNKNYWRAPSGVPGVETTFPLLLDAALQEKISLNGVVELLCANPAQILGLEGKKGAVARGADADLVLVDPQKTWQLKSSLLYTKCAWTPYEGKILKGKIISVFSRGKQAFDGRNVIAKEGTGRPADQ